MRKNSSSDLRSEELPVREMKSGGKMYNPFTFYAPTKVLFGPETEKRPVSVSVNSADHPS